ncbi:hypothetical protein COHA_006025 [Chlorella ohadii]|uniref:Nodulin homeobox N-terminal domain-containing protein n=1 Tax=Chlorella ohadii TaxID=2649997 RepID=A0AAD5H467_9CHLO|nr:hypothetical protein COHA_006025 [Chlorella ohadii]
MSLHDPRRLGQGFREDEDQLDVFNCVEQLHAADLHRMLSQERGEYRFNRVPRPGQAPVRVSPVALALVLPRHALGCLLAGQPAVPPDADTPTLTSAAIESTSHFEHIAKALTLLTGLCELALHHRGLRDAVLSRPDFGTQLVDAANMVLLAVTGPEADACVAGAGEQARVQAALDRAAMVPAALRALAFAFTARGGPQAVAAAVGGVLDWQSICEAVLTHPRGAMLLEAGFDAVRTVVLAVRAALVGDTQGAAVYRLAYYAGAAMELLSYMCVTPLFYHRLMLHDASGAAPLRLVLACLTLHDTPLAAPPFARSADRASSATSSKLVAVQPPYRTEKGEGAAELLAARGFALLLMLAECEDPSFMDQVSQNPATRRLADHVNNRAAAYIGQVLLRPSTALYPAVPGESQMAINTLRAAELLSDDSNFRAGLIPLLAPTAAHLLASDPRRFPLALEDDILINSVSMASLEVVRGYERAAAAAFPPVRGKAGRALRMGQQLALERGVLLAKLLVNLHVYVEGSCSPELKDAFVRRLIQVLRSPAAQATQRLQTTLRNLQSLHQLLAPFGPPHAGPDQQLLSEIDMALMADLVARISDALRQSMQPAAPAAAATQQQPPQQQQLAGGQPEGAAQQQQHQQHQQQGQQQQGQATPSPAASVHQLQQSVQQQLPPQQEQEQQEQQRQESTDLGSADRTMLDANRLGGEGGEDSVALKSEPEAAMEIDG